MATLSVQVPAIVVRTAPRGARVAAAWFSQLLASVSAPVVKTRSEEAAEVREMAYRLQRSEPGFAADLFAAAARHESKDD